MGEMGIAQLRDNLRNPQRTYLWKVFLEGIPISGGGNIGQLRFRAQSTSKPARNVGRILVPYMQTAGISYPGKLNFTHDWPVTFIDGEDQQVANALYAWQEYVIQVRTGESANVSDSANSIKGTATVQLLKTNGQDSPGGRYTLRGVYIQNVAQLDLSFQNEAAAIYSATFSFDEWEKA